MDLVGLSDPYVKVSLMSGEKRLKKVKTAVRAKTLEPTYNETFSFDISPSQITVYFQKVGKVVLGPNAVGTGLEHWKNMLAEEPEPVTQWHQLQPMTDRS
ncbi:unnamed protein product [Didymodactylos carnosus]|uniref:C2 domain-containing protein n=1 Tax=Didymodactylos carnosus TaxID=1234261 RepID=A0A814PZB6_9BILA|nr:unnamed protein product [Didymodactylos carnosus]CAF1112528.1 unnamed protein product [Didymodactylos carnosus]CAF3786171.1 unnamed protein product [Didymodactylos carnosus]CAF3876720.1 unnamed protein product [Didymodactylos carnosus]